jgi:hypothetical protein
MKGNNEMGKGMGGADKHFRMGQSIKAIGKMMSRKVKEYLFKQMEGDMKAHLKMKKAMAQGLTHQRIRK